MGKKYYVIVGSFEIEENARKFAADLKTKGFEPFIMKKKGRFFLVVADVFGDLKQADELMRRLETENPGSGIWIMPE